MAYNVKRTERMKRKSSRELVGFVNAKTLSSAAAYHELKQRKELHLLASREG
jgi:hypothetical protein